MHKYFCSLLLALLVCIYAVTLIASEERSAENGWFCFFCIFSCGNDTACQNNCYLYCLGWLTNSVPRSTRLKLVINVKTPNVKHWFAFIIDLQASCIKRLMLQKMCCLYFCSVSCVSGGAQAATRGLCIWCYPALNSWFQCKVNVKKTNNCVEAFEKPVGYVFVPSAWQGLGCNNFFHS